MDSITNWLASQNPRKLYADTQDPWVRLEINLTPEDHDRVWEANGSPVLVQDAVTKMKYQLRRSECTLPGCRCGIALVGELWPENTLNVIAFVRQVPNYTPSPSEQWLARQNRT
jgi:hypothetical protein